MTSQRTSDVRLLTGGRLERQCPGRAVCAEKGPGTAEEVETTSRCRSRGQRRGGGRERTCGENEKKMGVAENDEFI